MNLRKNIFVVTIFLFFFITVIGIYSVSVSSITLHKQNVPMFILQASESDVVSSSFTTALAISPLENGRNLYFSRQDTQNIAVIDTKNKSKKIKPISVSSAKAVSINSKGRIFIANDSELIVADSEGNWINKFPIPKTTLSIAALSDNDVAVAATDADELITVFDKSGNAIRKIGNLKHFDGQNVAQNRFLNVGKITANQSGDIYHVSMFSPAPVVQKFSKQGRLLKEFAVEGAAVELQSKHAKGFLNEKNPNCVGGYYVIRAANVDQKTGHLWVGMNGSSGGNSVKAESGVLYEYDSEGKKLAEYALKVSSTAGKELILTDINEIDVSFPYAYVLTSQGRVYQFDINQKTAVDLNQQNLSPEDPTFEACPPQQSYACSANCPVNSTPQSVDCAAYLRARLAQGDVIISGTCDSGSTVGNYGGCRGSITSCDSTGQTFSSSVTLNCNAAPTPTPTPEPEPEPTPTPTPRGEIGGGCDSTPWDCANSPIVIDISGNGFNLTNAMNGVRFDLNNDDVKEQLSWTSANSDDAWLALDRNGNGTIDSGRELFGNFTPQPNPPAGEERNGFLALAKYDKPQQGGNSDGEISQQDEIFSSLQLWQDKNHNGISEINELKTLSELGVAKIELDYKESKRMDEHGNRFKYRAKVKDIHGAQVGRWAWDVFLVVQQPNN